MQFLFSILFPRDCLQRLVPRRRPVRHGDRQAEAVGDSVHHARHFWREFVDDHDSSWSSLWLITFRSPVGLDYGNEVGFFFFCQWVGGRFLFGRIDRVFFFLKSLTFNDPLSTYPGDHIEVTARASVTSTNPAWTIDYRCDNRRFWLSAHNCQVPTPASQNLELEPRIRIFGAD